MWVSTPSAPRATPFTDKPTLRGELVTLLDDYDPVSSFGRYLYACYTPSRVRLPKVRVLLDELEACFMPVPPWEKAV